MDVQGRSLSLLEGRRLEYVRLDHAVILGFTGDRQVVIESVVHLDGPGGRVDVEPGDDSSDALATLLGDVVRTARTRGTGELELTFGSGSALLVDVETDVESWAVTGPDGFLIVCMAHGELAVWGDAGAGDSQRDGARA
ncbi:DUF6188 family protein [Actinoplanes sp. GCM10030250]|uniref:DUF6188 family protein n=1 Tax=Actinoplanes sp. GCM10030250 TaxID=3273376 RepID=UPI00361B81FE